MSFPCMPGTHRVALALVLYGLTAAVAANVRPVPAGQHSLLHFTCDQPVRLTRDCSPWHGATRPIAFADFRMALAADVAGRTILLSGLRRAPDHNQHRFPAPGTAARLHSRQVIHAIGKALGQKGFELQKVQALRRGPRVRAYLLEFSANVYDYLKQFTVLESEHWLPAARRRR